MCYSTAGRRRVATFRDASYVALQVDVEGSRVSPLILKRLFGVTVQG